MPPACPVDRYVLCYTTQHRSNLKCHRLARWIVTFLATPRSIAAIWNATGLSGGSLRSSLQHGASQQSGMPPACPVDRYVPCYTTQHRSNLKCHRLARGGSLRSLLHHAASQQPEMPPACPVDRYVPCYTTQHRSNLKCHRLARWIVTFLATVAENVRIPGLSRGRSSMAALFQATVRRQMVSRNSWSRSGRGTYYMHATRTPI